MDSRQPRKNQSKAMLEMVNNLIESASAEEGPYNGFTVENTTLCGNSEVPVGSPNLEQENARLKEVLASEKAMREQLQELNGRYVGMIFNISQLLTGGSNLTSLIIEAGGFTGYIGDGPSAVVQITSEDILGRMNDIYNYIKNKTEMEGKRQCSRRRKTQDEASSSKSQRIRELTDMMQTSPVSPPMQFYTPSYGGASRPVMEPPVEQNLLTRMFSGNDGGHALLNGLFTQSGSYQSLLDVYEEPLPRSSRNSGPAGRAQGAGNFQLPDDQMNPRIPMEEHVNAQNLPNNGAAAGGERNENAPLDENMQDDERE